MTEFLPPKPSWLSEPSPVERLRHCWVTPFEHGRVPALLLEWRETPDGWKGRVMQHVINEEADWRPAQPGDPRLACEPSAHAGENWIDAVAPLFMHEVTSRGADGSVESVIRVADSDAAYTKRALSVLRQTKRASRRKVGPELWERVADVYQSDPDRPAEAVQHAFGVSARTAYRYIRDAREHGHLEGSGKD